MCNIDDHLLIFQETMLKTSSLFNQSVQLHDARSIHAKIGQEFFIIHVHTIMEHLFPMAVPFSIWMMKHILWWLKNFQLCCYTIINLIFKAVLFIKAKRIYAFSTWNFATASYSFNKLALFEILGILGWSKLWWSDWLIWKFAKNMR